MSAEAIVIDPKRARVERLRASVREAAKLHEEEALRASHRLGRSAYRKTFITLTYRDGGDWQRRHISEFIKHLRQWLGRRAARCLYAWVAELQKRGALHYHMLVWVPRGLRLPRPDASGWWPHGMSNIETARNPVGYMVKYATKTTPADLKRLKKGVRLHGNGGHSPVNRVALRETLAPWWLKQAAAHRQVEVPLSQLEDLGRLAAAQWKAQQMDSDEWRAAERERLRRKEAAEDAMWAAYADAYYSKGCPKFRRVTGGFLDLVTGELLPTPWRVTVERGIVTAHRISETLQ